MSTTGCEPTADARASASAPPAAAQPERGSTAPQPATPLEADQTQLIPAGEFALGSRPGTAGRDPRHEADLYPLRLPAFQIDRLPYPNDPAQPPLTGKTRSEAAALCTAAGKRLCSEIEWEHACKGPTGEDFPSTSSGEFDPVQCRSSPDACTTGYGVASMGLHAKEWTSSDTPSGLGQPARTGVLRGGGANVDARWAHRCAARSGAPPDSSNADIAFRCCQGPAPEASYPEVTHASEAVADLDLDADTIRSALASVEALAPLSAGFELFDRGDIDAALRRGGRSRDGIALWSFPGAAFSWSPVPGEEVWVLSGRTAEGALIALLYPLGEGHFEHAASTIVAEKDATVAIGWNPEYREQLVWSTCWNCPGAGGIVVLGEDSRLAFSYR